ncbi:MAG: AAA family ATPase [Acidimicrobiia bacterium]|nr:AAA family ATPase [Acidimicrobiia bacterium]
MPRYVLTGAPGTGKTTVLAQLADRLTIVEEPARGIIAEHMASTGEPGLDHRPGLFVSRLIAKSVENYHSVSETEIGVFDRGLPDCVAYATITGVDPGKALKAASTLRYENPVFVAHPWEEIYAQDDMRRATYSQVEEFHAHLVRAYAELGYELLELPKASVGERAAFVADAIDSTAKGPRSSG